MREFSKYKDTLVYFSAVVGNLDRFKSRVLLHNIKAIDGHTIDSHVWVRTSKRFKGIIKGDCITFRAKVEQYERLSTRELDCGLRELRNISKVNKD